VPVPDSVVQIVRTLFRENPVIAVLGAHPTRHRAAYYVPAYLKKHGAHILSVNPHHAGTRLHEETCLATLAEATAHPACSGRLDAVVVFRASHALPTHTLELLDARPHLTWFQLGIQNDPVAETLRTAGLTVVQDRCLKVDHARAIGF